MPLLLALAIALAAPAPDPEAECRAGCRWAYSLCIDFAHELLEARPGPVGEKAYVLQLWACYESAVVCVRGC